jgi:hypothetical protein
MIVKAGLFSRWLMKRRIKRMNWHQWFAWHPVKIQGTYAWFCQVQRKGEWWEWADGLTFWDYAYRYRGTESAPFSHFVREQEDLRYLLSQRDAQGRYLR